jgi:hypothetical protein
VSFTFTGGFPSYQFAYVDTLIGDGSGLPVPVRGKGVLRVVFRPAAAHDEAGNPTAPRRGDVSGRTLGRVLAYANAGDYEAVLTYGIGVDWPVAHSNPQIPVRIYEVEKITASGQHVYVVAVDVDAS